MASSDERISSTTTTTTLESTTGLPPEWNEWVYENRNTISALSASFCSTVAGFPLDSVKLVLPLSSHEPLGIEQEVLYITGRELIESESSNTNRSRLQVKRYSSVLDCARRTYADEGVRGFFRGGTLKFSHTLTFPHRYMLSQKSKTY